MASGNVHGANDPLLGKPGKAQSDGPLQPVSTNAHTALKALAIIRIATGAACLAAPRFTCALFKYNVPVEQTLLVRMFGVRDAVLGELLITAENKNASDGGRRELRRAIYAGMACDLVDIGSVVYAIAMGHIGRTTGGLLGAAAVSAIGLGLVGLRAL